MNDGAKTETPYRDAAEGTNHCAFCSKPTLSDRCLRCGRGLCVLHLPGKGQRCEACENDYHAQRRAVRYWLIGGVASLLPLSYWTMEILRHWNDPSYGMAGKTMGLPELLVGIVGTVVISCGFFLGLTIWLLRRRFLAQRLGGQTTTLGTASKEGVPPGAEVAIAPRSADDVEDDELVRGRKVRTWSRTYYGGGSDPNNH